jgi:radical SAM protein with 4Fe4S-binding SPASM domain
MHLHDSLQILKRITPSRFWNLIVLRASYYLAKLKVFKVWGMPFAASIEPTTACNLGCPECPSGLKQFTRPTGRLDTTAHEKMLASIGKQTFYINYYFQGEPFIHPKFLELIQTAHQRNIYTATSTNAHFISAENAKDIVKSGLDRLIISIDGLTQATYEQYRVHGKLEKVIEGTKHMVAAKKALKSKTPHLIFQFLVVKPNEHEISAVFDLAKELKVNEVRLKTAQLYDYENGNPLLPENEKYARYTLGKDGKYHPKYKLLDQCWRMWSSTVLTWDGKVVPCCFDKDAKHVLGDVTKAHFKTIWKSTQYTNFRKAVFTNRQAIDICKNCSEGTKVWA